MTNYSHKIDLDDCEIIALENLLKFYFEYWNADPSDRHKVMMAGVNHQPIKDIQKAIEKSWETIAKETKFDDSQSYRLPFIRPDDR